MKKWQQSFGEKTKNVGVAHDRDRETVLFFAVAKHDRRAFYELFELYRPRLSRFLVQTVKRPALAEEVLNETMLAVWEGAKKFEGRSGVSTWIFAIAYRQAMKALRHNDDPVEDDAVSYLDSPDQGPEADAMQAQRMSAIKAAMNKLSSDHRAVIDLTYFHGLKYREIAEVMDCPEDTIKTRMFHARRQLKTHLTDNKTDWL